MGHELCGLLCKKNHILYCILGAILIEVVRAQSFLGNTFCKSGFEDHKVGQSESINYLLASHPHVLKLARPIKSCHLGPTKVQSSAN
jgi:hypothetical protein